MDVKQSSSGPAVYKESINIMIFFSSERETMPPHNVRGPGGRFVARGAGGRGQQAGAADRGVQEAGRDRRRIRVMSSTDSDSLDSRIVRSRSLTRRRRSSSRNSSPRRSRSRGSSSRPARRRSSGRRGSPSRRRSYSRERLGRRRRSTSSPRRRRSPSWLSR